MMQQHMHGLYYLHISNLSLILNLSVSTYVKVGGKPMQGRFTYKFNNYIIGDIISVNSELNPYA